MRHGSGPPARATGLGTRAGGERAVGEPAGGEPAGGEPAGGKPAGGALLLAGVLLLGLNLRGTIAGLTPLVPDIQADLALDRATAGLLTTLPVLCFGLLSPVAALLGRRLGVEVALFAAMLAVATGSLIRTAPGAGWLIAGTLVIGAGITAGNVLVPTVVKQDFPARRQGSVTGLSTAALIGGATIAAAISTPLAHDAGLGWRAALLLLGAPAVLAALVWAPRLRRRHRLPAGGAGTSAVLGSRVTWYLAVFMGTQSLAYYGLLAWLPALLRDEGVSAARAGAALAVFNLLGIGTALLTPMLANRLAGQRGLALVICAGWMVGLGGLLVAPWAYPLWAAVCGLAQGAAISLAFALIVLRAGSPAAARDLSGTVQSVGYLIGAAGPFVLGALRDRAGSWDLPLVALCVVVAVMAGAGAGAGRGR